MARDDVNIKVSADEAEMIAMWKAAKEGPEKMATAMEGASRRGKQASRSLGGELDGVVGKWMSIHAAIGLVQRAFGAYMDQQRELRELTEQSTDSLDDLLSKFRVQAGSGIADGQEGRFFQGIIDVAAQRRVASSTAIPAAQQLVSSGVGAEQVVFGGVLDEVLQLFSAVNASGQEADPTTTTKALVRYMRSTGVPRTREGTRSTAVALRGLFEGTDLQIANLERYSGEASTIGEFAGLTPNQSLAVFTQFIDALGENRGSTSFRAGVVSLATAGANASKVKALKMLGLQPADVDFQGEDFSQAIERLSKGFGSVEPAQANVAASLLFGQEGLGFYNTLVNRGGQAETRRRMGLLGGEQTYAEMVAYAEASRGAKRNLAGLSEQAAFYDPSQPTYEETRQLMRSALEQSGRSSFLPGFVFSTYEKFGYSPEEAAEHGINASFAWPQESRKLLEQSMGREPIDIRIQLTGPDGHDIPHKVEVNKFSEPVGAE